MPSWKAGTAQAIYRQIVDGFRLAIARDELYAISHPGRRIAVQGRVDRLLAAFDVEPAEPGFAERFSAIVRSDACTRSSP